MGVHRKVAGDWSNTRDCLQSGTTRRVGWNFNSAPTLENRLHPLRPFAFEIQHEVSVGVCSGVERPRCGTPLTSSCTAVTSPPRVGGALTSEHSRRESPHAKNSHRLVRGTNHGNSE